MSRRGAGRGRGDGQLPWPGAASGLAGAAFGRQPGGCSSGTPVVAARPQPALARVRNGGDSAVRCASLRVPLDYAHPAGRKITLALSEVPATAPPSQRQGVLLVNPGGPGGSGLPVAALVGSRD